MNGGTTELTQKAFDCGEEFINRKGLAEVIVSAGLLTHKTVFISVPRRNHNNRDVLELLLELEKPSHLVSIHARQHNIEDNQVRLFSESQLEAIMAVIGRQTLIIFLSEPDLKGFDQIRFIVYNENPFFVHALVSGSFKETTKSTKSTKSMIG
jgi:hypothetical protein